MTVYWNLQKFHIPPQKNQYLWKVFKSGVELNHGELIGYKNQAAIEAARWLRDHSEPNVVYDIVVYFLQTMNIAEASTWRRIK